MALSGLQGHSFMPGMSYPAPMVPDMNDFCRFDIIVTITREDGNLPDPTQFAIAAPGTARPGSRQHHRRRVSPATLSGHTWGVWASSGAGMTGGACGVLVPGDRVGTTEWERPARLKFAA